MVSRHDPLGSTHSTNRPASERALRNIAFFQAVSAATLADMGQRCRWLTLDEGVSLVPAGEHPDKVFFLLRGELRFSLYTRVGKIVSLRGASQGAFVGEAALSDDAPIPYSIEAVKPSVVASMNVKTFMDFVDRDRDLMRSLIRNLIDRQQMLEEQVVELSTLTVHARIHNELARLCRDGMRADGSAIIAPVPNQSELARRVGTQREAVSREMSHLQHQGIVLRGDGALLVPDVSRLLELQASLDD